LYSSLDLRTTQLSTLSLHDALPISPRRSDRKLRPSLGCLSKLRFLNGRPGRPESGRMSMGRPWISVWASFLSTDGSRSLGRSTRSEEHTSELQSRFDLVCRLLLEKK